MQPLASIFQNALLAIDCPNGQVALSVRIGGSNCVNGIYAYLQRVVTLIEGLIGVAIVIAIIVSGLQYITSAGSPDAVRSAKKRLFNAVISLVLYLMAVAIIKALGLGGVLG